MVEWLLSLIVVGGGFLETTGIADTGAGFASVLLALGLGISGYFYINRRGSV